MERLDWSPISISAKEVLKAPFSSEEIKKVVFGFVRKKYQSQMVSLCHFIKIIKRM